MVILKNPHVAALFFPDLFALKMTNFTAITIFICNISIQGSSLHQYVWDIFVACICYLLQAQYLTI